GDRRVVGVEVGEVEVRRAVVGGQHAERPAAAAEQLGPDLGGPDRAPVVLVRDLVGHLHAVAAQQHVAVVLHAARDREPRPQALALDRGAAERALGLLEALEVAAVAQAEDTALRARQRARRGIGPRRARRLALHALERLAGAGALLGA